MKTIILIVVTLLVRCRSAPAGEHPAGDTTDTATVRVQSPAQDTASHLVQTLWSAAGEFQEHVPIVGGFSGDRAAFYAVRDFVDRGGDFATTIVSLLVDCMDRVTPAAATWAGSNVSEGMVCYAALRSVAYHEAVDETGELTGDWAGYVLFGATPEEMIAAKEAWQAVVENGWYNLL